MLSQKSYLSAVESGKLIEITLSIMEVLPNLCSPKGKSLL